MVPVVTPEDAVAHVRGFVERNRGVYPVTEWFPYNELTVLSSSKQVLPADLGPVLVDLLGMTGRYEESCYEGDDLRRDACVVRALLRCPPDAALVPVIVAMLRGATFDRHYAEPGGTPDIDKYDRDSSIENAQDELARVCALLLGQLPTDEAAHVALQDARRHRSDEVRDAAYTALRSRRW